MKTVITRFDRLRGFMVERQLVWKDLGEACNASANACRMACMKDKIGKKFHEKLICFGVPEDLLPPINPRSYNRKPIVKISQITNIDA